MIRNESEGCALSLAVLAAVGFLAGATAYWIGAPGWAPLAGAAGVPGGCVAAYVGLIAWDKIKERIGR